MWSFYVSIAFIIATIATLQCPNKELKQNLSQYLDKKEQNYYQEIIIMRRNIYFQGLGLGILLGIGSVFLIPKLKKAKKMVRLLQLLLV